MNRRVFCRRMATISGTLLIGPLAQACSRSASAPLTSPSPITPASQPTVPTLIRVAPIATIPPTSAPPIQPTAASILLPTSTAIPATAVPSGAGVALVRTTDRVAGVRRAIELLGINPVRSERILIKPNFNSADPAPGSTHDDLLRSLITMLGDMGGRQVTLVDRSGMGDTRTVIQQKGVFAMAKNLGFDIRILDELAANEWTVQQSGDFHWSRGFAIPKMVLDAPCIVQTCNLKTHRFGGHFTLSLKNSVGLAAKTIDTGGYNYMQELHTSPDQRHLIAEINTAYTPALIVLDGVEAFVDGGPDKGTRVAANVLLAGTDRVAIDAVGVAILRLLGTTPAVSRGRIFEQEQIARAVELGLGTATPDQISIITGDPESAAYAEQVRAILVA